MSSIQIRLSFLLLLMRAFVFATPVAIHQVSYGQGMKTARGIHSDNLVNHHSQRFGLHKRRPAVVGIDPQEGKGPEGISTQKLSEYTSLGMDRHNPTAKASIHGAPGVQDSKIAQGLLEKAPIASHSFDAGSGDNSDGEVTSNSPAGNSDVTLGSNSVSSFNGNNGLIHQIEGDEGNDTQNGGGPSGPGAGPGNTGTNDGAGGSSSPPPNTSQAPPSNSDNNAGPSNSGSQPSGTGNGGSGGASGPGNSSESGNSSTGNSGTGASRPDNGSNSGNTTGSGNSGSQSPGTGNGGSGSASGPGNGGNSSTGNNGTGASRSDNGSSTDNEAGHSNNSNDNNNGNRGPANGAGSAGNDNGADSGQNSPGNGGNFDILDVVTTESGTGPVVAGNLVVVQ